MSMTLDFLIMIISDEKKLTLNLISLKHSIFASQNAALFIALNFISFILSEQSFVWRHYMNDVTIATTSSQLLVNNFPRGLKYLH